MTSGDPRKQPRPDGRTDQVTKAFPPTLAAVMTEIETRVVPFGFPGGKAIEMVCHSGDLKIVMHFPPQAAETVIDAVRQAQIRADTGLEVASLDQMPKVAA